MIIIFDTKGQQQQESCIYCIYERKVKRRMTQTQTQIVVMIMMRHYVCLCVCTSGGKEINARLEIRSI